MKACTVIDERCSARTGSYRPSVKGKRGRHANDASAEIHLLVVLRLSQLMRSVYHAPTTTATSILLASGLCFLLLTLILSHFSEQPSFLSAFIVLLASSTIVRPRMVLYVAITLYFLGWIDIEIGGTYTSLNMTLCGLLYLSLFILLPFYILQYKDSNSRFNACHFAILLFMLVEMVSLLWSPSNQRLYFFFQIFQNITVIIIPVFLITKREHLVHAVICLIIAAFIAGTAGAVSLKYNGYHFVFDLAETVKLDFLFDDFVGRAAGFYSSNQTAAILYIGLLCLAALIPYTSKIRKFLLYLLFLYLTMCLSMTASRGGIISTLVALCFVAFFHHRFLGKKLTYAVKFLSLTVIGLICGNYKILDTLLVGLGFSGALVATEHHAGSRGSGVAMRLQWWSTVLGFMLEKPVTLIYGLGVGGYAFFNADNLPPHSVWMQFFFQLGIIGILLFAFLYLTIGTEIINILKRRHDSSLEYACFLGLAASVFACFYVHGAIDNDFDHRFPSVLLGITFAGLNIMKAKYAKATKSIESACA